MKSEEIKAKRLDLEQEKSVLESRIKKIDKEIVALQKECEHVNSGAYGVGHQTYGICFDCGKDL